jgi:hypothetical protein
MSDNSSGGSREVASLFSRGRLPVIPRKAARRRQLLTHLAQTLFEPDRVYDEREVNDALLAVHDDYPALRRHLVDAGLLIRPKDGSSYRRADPVR